MRVVCSILLCCLILSVNANRRSRLDDYMVDPRWDEDQYEREDDENYNLEPHPEYYRSYE